MKTIYLHIGTHKTGSTSIQRFLAAAQETLLAQGVLYPKTGRPDTDWSNQYGHHQLAWSLVGKRGITSEAVWRALRQEIDARPETQVLISAEDLEVCAVQDIRRLIAHLDPYPIRVIVYLRPPFSFLKSGYAQQVKMGTCDASFSRFVQDMIPRCNYQTLVSRWEQFERITSVDIRLFDKVKQDPGLEASFAEAAHVDFDRLRSFARSPSNRSPSDTVVQVVRWINVAERLGSFTPWRTLTQRARSNVLGRRWPGRPLVAALRPLMRDHDATDEARNALKEALGDAHQHFLESYIPRRDWKYLAL